MLLAASAAHGALISVSTETLSSTGAEIIPLSTVVAAWDVNSNAASQVLNGVTFSNTIPSAFTVSSGLSAAAAQDHVLTASYYPAGSALREIMGDLIATTASGGTGTFTASGLTVGHTYRIEFLAHQDVAASTRSMQIHFGPDATGTGTGFFQASQPQPP